jgi:predicted negative regulator of RcsB-dependent stress response
MALFQVRFSTGCGILEGSELQAMVSPIKSKEIRVQKPAQSLQAFQAKLETGEDSQLSFLKPVLIIVGVALVASLGFFGYRSWSTGVMEKHEAALADLALAVQGDPKTPPQPADIEKRMRENLPKLEALAKNAPASQKALTEGILATWKLELDGKGGIAAKTDDPWSRLRTAQRQIALGQGQDATATLTPLRASANPSEAWASVYWKTLLEARSLQGDREQALKDYAEYKQRFREDADIRGMESILIGI